MPSEDDKIVAETVVEEPPPLSPSSDSQDAQVSQEERKAGRRLPSRPVPLTKTLRTNNLPHSRAQSAVEPPSPRKQPPPIPKKIVLPPTPPPHSIDDSNLELTADDFVWGAKRSASMPMLGDATDVSESPSDPSPTAARSVNRAYAMTNGSITSSRKFSTLDASTAQEALAAIASSASAAAIVPTSTPADISPRRRESQAIVLKLGITPAQEETPEMMRTRGNLADEILKTEAVYLEDLRLIVSKFLVPLRANMKVISATDSAKLFLNIESLELISEEVHNAMNLAFMQSSSSAQVSLAPIYLQFTETLLSGFSLYCAGHSESLSLLTRLKKKQAGFSSFLESLEADEALNKLKLADFLTRPIQHICRQPLLLRELLKATSSSHPDYEDLVFALAKINDLVERVNSNAKEVSNIQAITNVESSVYDLPESLKLLMPGRYMLKEGRFLRVSQKLGKLPAEHFLFLFNDMLLLTKPKPFNDGEYLFTELLPLHSVMVEDLQDSDDFKNAFSVTSLVTLRTHTFVAKDERKNNEIIKRDWLNSIANAKTKFEKGLVASSSSSAGGGGGARGRGEGGVSGTGSGGERGGSSSGAPQEDSSLQGIAFKVQSGSTSASDYTNPYQAMRDQLSSVAAQQRIIGWKGTEILREIYNANNAINSTTFTSSISSSMSSSSTSASAISSSSSSTSTGSTVTNSGGNSSLSSSSSSFSLPPIIKFHLEAPCAIKIMPIDLPEVIENEGQVFVFDDFIVIASEKKEPQVKRPYEWLDSVIYSTCVIANSTEPETEKKILGGRTVYPLTLISASTQKRFILYFRSEILKNNIYNTIKHKFAYHQDEGAANGSSSFVYQPQKREKSSSEEADKASTLKTKKSFFGRKLGYRTTSQSISSSSNAPSDAASTGIDSAKHFRIHSQSTMASMAANGMPTPILFAASSSAAGNLNIGSSYSAYGNVAASISTTTTSSQSTPPGTLANWMQTVADDDHDEPEEKLLTAEGFEVPPWAPDDSSGVCLGCGSKFTTTNRRHHCRNCGQLFCKKCTQKKCYLPRYGFTQKKMRVCEKCFLKH